MNKKLISTAFTAFLLTGCTTSGGLSSMIPDRAPDYHQSSVGRGIEVPPDLSNATVDDSMAVSDFTPSSIASYNAYQNERVQRNSRGYIEVLPQLYGVQVVENAGALPYITTTADASDAWQLVKRYWQHNGVRLALDNPQIGIMETDWLENASNKPSAGISGFLNGLLGFLSDSDERDRYRMHFMRNAQGGTNIALLYTKTELVASKDFASGKDHAGFTWQTSDTQNPELQLEMTRRIALYLSSELEKNAGIKHAEQGNVQTNAAQVGQAVLTQLDSGQPALAIYGNYAQSWRVLGIALDRASFSIESEEYETGTYRVRYMPATDEKEQSFFSKLWGSSNESATKPPQYLVRLADQGDFSVAVVQNADGSAANTVQAQALLETVNSAR